MLLPSLSIPFLHGDIFPFQPLLFYFFFPLFPSYFPSLPQSPPGGSPCPGWVPTAALPGQRGHSAGHLAAKNNPGGRAGPPRRHPRPPTASPNGTRDRNKAAEAVSQRAGGGELESSSTKRALCALHARRRRTGVSIPPPKNLQICPVTPKRAPFFSPRPRPMCALPRRRRRERHVFLPCSLSSSPLVFLRGRRRRRGGGGAGLSSEAAPAFAHASFPEKKKNNINNKKIHIYLKEALFFITGRAEIFFLGAG